MWKLFVFWAAAAEMAWRCSTVRLTSETGSRKSKRAVNDDKDAQEECGGDRNGREDKCSFAPERSSGSHFAGRRRNRKGSETRSCFCVSGEGLDREHLEWRDAP